MTHPMSDILDGVAIPFAYRLGYVVNSYREPSSREIEAKLGLTRSEHVSLVFLCYRDGISAADICDFTGHLKNNISRAIASLEAKGMIWREAHGEDLRRLLIYVTPAGRKLHEKFMPGLRRREQELLGTLTERDKADLDRILRKLCAHVPSWSAKEHL